MLTYTNIRTGNIEGVLSDKIERIEQPYNTAHIHLKSGEMIYTKETAHYLIKKMEEN